MTREEMIAKIENAGPKAMENALVADTYAKLLQMTDAEFEAEKARELAVAPNHRQAAKLKG